MTNRTRLNDLISRPTVRLAMIGISVVGYLLLVEALIGHGIYSAGGEGAGDAFAYYRAGEHVRTGAPVYGVAVGGYAAYLYPPVLAQIMAPLSLLPFPVFVWGWRLVQLACLRSITGSWTWTGLALLLWPPLLSEIDACNVHLFIAAAVAMAIRSDGRAVVPVALTKFASLAAVPLALVSDRRGLAFGTVLAVVIVAISFALSPSLWIDYLQFLPQVPRLDTAGYNIGRDVPLLPRFAVAGLLALAAMRWRRLAAVSATLALPVIWFHGLSVLVAASPHAPSVVHPEHESRFLDRVAIRLRLLIPRRDPRST